MTTTRLAAAVLFVSACATTGARRAPAPARAATRFDHEGLTFDLPGAWREAGADGGGYELRRGDVEQVMVAFFPPLENLDAAASAEKLAGIQHDAFQRLCKSGFRGAAVERAAAADLLAWRTGGACDEPRVIVAYRAGIAGGRVVSYEHYRYGAAAPPELERDDAAIAASMKWQAAAASGLGCPDSVVRAASQDGTCLEPAVLGDAAAAACARLFEGRGWMRDEVAAKMIGAQSGKKLVCYHGAH